MSLINKKLTGTLLKLFGKSKLSLFKLSVNIIRFICGMGDISESSFILSVMYIVYVSKGKYAFFNKVNSVRQ